VGKEKKSQKTSKILREFSSGGVVFKKLVSPKTKEFNILWLVAKSKPSEEYPLEVWRLAKGWIDDSKDGKYPGPISTGKIKATEEDLCNTAIREVKEEGGVIARVINKIGSEMYVINSKLRGAKVLKFVTFYLMEWAKDIEDGFGDETSEVLWLDFDDARKKLTYPREKKTLDKAKKLLDSLDNHKV
jgi:8-oxo-dGTP pyrophosphatase MutT (NUDIX family)